MLLSRLPLISALALCVLFACSIYWQTASFLQPSPRSSNLNEMIKKPPARSTQTKITHDIAKFNLFGDTSQKPIKAIAIEKNLPKTKLRLTLTGVLVNQTDASALILGPNNQTEYYRINDELPGGATLKQVYPDRVIVNRSGRLENLYFVESKPLDIQRFAPDDTNSLTPQEQGTAPPPQSKEITNARSQSIKSRLSKLKKRLLKKQQ